MNTSSSGVRRAASAPLPPFTMPSCGSVASLYHKSEKSLPIRFTGGDAMSLPICCQRQKWSMRFILVVSCERLAHLYRKIRGCVEKSV
jgi:hypothetical protein